MGECLEGVTGAGVVGVGRQGVAGARKEGLSSGVAGGVSRGVLLGECLVEATSESAVGVEAGWLAEAGLARMDAGLLGWGVV